MLKPVDVMLHLDTRRLPAEIFERFTRRQSTVAAVRERSRLAWLNFGKPGRDPNRLGAVIRSLAQHGDWTPHLKLADLSTHWDEIVGAGIAAHSHVASYDHGRLTIRAESTVWATQLTYLIPQMKPVISRRLSGLPITAISVTGPHAYSFHRGPYDVPGRGVRDTYF